MDNPFFSFLAEHYHGLLSLSAFIGILAVSFVIKKIALLNPVINETHKMNKDAYENKMESQYYSANQKKNRFWGLIDNIVIFGLILPFFITIEAQPIWQILLDIVIILMFYDFFYYLTHRFLFHDGPLGGPLVKVHAVHHQQKNPCRQDSSYIHPLEVAMGLGLYIGSIVVLSTILGPFHVVTVILTWIAFSEINLHNHDLFEANRFPFKYLNYAAKMHHVHHAKFTGGNYATITLLYDWMFGTLDNGEGYGKTVQKV